LFDKSIVVLLLQFTYTRTKFLVLTAIYMQKKLCVHTMNTKKYSYKEDFVKKALFVKNKQ